VTTDQSPAFDPFAAVAAVEMVEAFTSVESSPNIDTSSSSDFNGGGGDFNGGGSDGSW